MKPVILMFAMIFIACGGSLSDEQRKDLREQMEENKIVRITEVEITEAAYAEGRKIASILDSLRADSAAVDAFVKSHDGSIRFITPDASNARMLEKQLIDAYLGDPGGAFQDNVQELRRASGGYDSLLYTRPVIKKLPDGTDSLEGVWNIWLTKKALVVEITKTK